MALFTITTNARVNLPPSQVGNGSAATGYGTTYVFTVADFTTDTVPPYSDPEGDAAFQLRVTSLPSVGELQLNGGPLSINQPVGFDQITAGLFTYVPDNGTTSAYQDPFEFEIADVGSKQFVG